MHLDKYGLPVQANGDANDQLQRVGMILTGTVLTKTSEVDCELRRKIAKTYYACKAAAHLTLQPKPGIYTRFVGGNTNNVSADQLISVLCYWIASGNVKQAAWMFFRMLCRFGFAQNYKDGLNADTKTKLPDFMLVRSLPLFIRAHWLLWPVAVLSDLLLVIAALASIGPRWADGQGFVKRTPDDVDYNVLVLTLAVCRARMVTPLSWLACKVFAKLMPVNLGNTVLGEPNRVQAALLWYHRESNGGNVEVAELWRPIVEKHLT